MIDPTLETPVTVTRWMHGTKREYEDTLYEAIATWQSSIEHGLIYIEKIIGKDGHVWMDDTIKEESPPKEWVVKTVEGRHQAIIRQNENFYCECGAVLLHQTDHGYVEASEVPESIVRTRHYQHILIERTKQETQ